LLSKYERQSAEQNDMHDVYNDDDSIEVIENNDVRNAVNMIFSLTIEISLLGNC
jgi:hypothetical protein